MDNSAGDAISAQPPGTLGQSAPGLCIRFTAGIQAQRINKIWRDTLRAVNIGTLRLILVSWYVDGRCFYSM